MPHKRDQSRAHGSRYRDRPSPRVGGHGSRSPSQAFTSRPCRLPPFITRAARRMNPHSSRQAPHTRATITGLRLRIRLGTITTTRTLERMPRPRLATTLRRQPRSTQVTGSRTSEPRPQHRTSSWYFPTLIRCRGLALRLRQR